MMTAFGDALMRVDHALLRSTRKTFGGTPAVAVARGLSRFGDHALGWLALGGVGWLTGRRRREWAVGLVGVVAAHGSGVAVKRVVRRVRPALDGVPPLVAAPSRLSFPSAHSCSTAAAAVCFGPMVGAPVLTGVTGLMLLSRVLLGVHYPSDVACGAVLGAGTAALVRRRMDLSFRRRA